MGNTVRLKTLVSAVSLALAGAGFALPMQHAMAEGATNAVQSAQKVADPAAASERRTYIIQFNEAGLMHYSGGVAGLASTSPAATGRRKLDVHSTAATDYMRFLSDQRTAHIAAINQALGRTIAVPHSYAITMNGISTAMTAAEASRVASLPGVKSVRASRDQQVTTFHGPEFIGASAIWDGSGVPSSVGNRGAGVVVGVIDTGANSTHPSFADDPTCGFSESNHKLLSTADCLTNSGGFCTGTDPEANSGNGHGVHTASTAAGNTLDASADPAPTIPAPYTTMSGVAPCASVRTYKVCATNNCAGDAIQAGIENAIADGVDVINFSISGGTDPWNDNDRLFLDAVGADVFVAASAGNTRSTNPTPEGDVNHLGPWVMTVAASTHDENVAGAGMLSATGPGTPPAGTTNISLTPGSGPNLGTASTDQEIRSYATNVTGCTASGGFPAGFFTGAIALISRGTCTFEEKINNAEAAGATVAIIYNNTTGTINMSVGGATLPAYSILQTEGTALVAFITANDPTPTTADFTPAVKQGDVLAGFSLRGPSALASVTKPDITATGVNIYAAVDPDSGNYAYMSGTSMSSPHTAGAGALVRAVHPDWTPAEVKSALMMTAYETGTKEDLVTPWDADDVGSGRVDLTKAALAGLVMNETYENFVAAEPPTGDPKTLNVPSMRDMACTDSCSWTRTVRNVLTPAAPSDRIFADGFDGAETPVTANWTVSTNAPSGLAITVSPTSFVLDGTTTTQELTITATPTTDLTDPTFGEVVLHETNGLAPDAHLTVAVMGTGGSTNPDIIDSGVVNLSVPDSFDGLYINWATGDTCTSSCSGGTYNFNPYDNGSTLAFYWPQNASSEGGVSLDGTTYAVLGSGVEIGPSSTYVVSTSSTASVNWAAGADGYVGFRFVCAAPGGFCYGYAHLTTTGATGFPATIVEYWYNQAGDPITTQ